MKKLCSFFQRRQLNLGSTPGNVEKRLLLIPIVYIFLHIWNTAEFVLLSTGFNTDPCTGKPLQTFFHVITILQVRQNKSVGHLAHTVWQCLTATGTETACEVIHVAPLVQVYPAWCSYHLRWCPIIFLCHWLSVTMGIRLMTLVFMKLELHVMCTPFYISVGMYVCMYVCCLTTKSLNLNNTKWNGWRW